MFAATNPPEKGSPSDPVPPFHKTRADMKLYQLNHPAVDAIILAYDGKLQPFFHPQLVPSIDGTKGFVLGYICDTLGNVTLMKCDSDEFVQALCSYVKNPTHLIPSANPVPDSFFNEEQKQQLDEVASGPVHTVYLSRFTVLPRGYTIEPIPVSDILAMEQLFDHMGQKDWLHAFYHSLQIEEGSLPSLLANGRNPPLPSHAPEKTTGDFSIPLVPVTLQDPDVTKQQCNWMVEWKNKLQATPSSEGRKRAASLVASSGEEDNDEDESVGFSDEHTKHHYPTFSITTKDVQKQTKKKARKSSAASLEITLDDDDDDEDIKYKILWRVLHCHRKADGHYELPSTSKSLQKLSHEKASTQPQLLSRMANHIRKKHKNSEGILSYIQEPPFNPAFTKFLLTGSFKRDVDTLDVGLCLVNFKKPDHTSASFAAAKRTSNAQLTEEIVGEDHRKREKKTGSPYASGLMRNRNDLITMIANVLGISKIFVDYKVTDKGPKPYILRVLFRVYQQLRKDETERWLDRGADAGYDLIPQIFDRVNGMFCLFIDAFTNLDVLDAAENGDYNFHCDEIQEAVDTIEDSLTNLKRAITNKTYTFFEKRAKHPSPSPSPTNRNTNRTKSNPNIKGSDPKKGLFVPTVVSSTKWIKLPRGFSVCQDFTIVGRSCTQKNCSYSHKRAHEITKAEADLLTDDWCHSNGISLHSEVQKRMKSFATKPSKPKEETPAPEPTEEPVAPDTDTPATETSTKPKKK